LREIRKLTVLVKLDEILNLYQPVSLEEMNNVSFLKRKDIKFVFHSDKLIPILHGLNEQYRLLTIGDNQVFRYRTLYLDTPDLKAYYDHHNGVRNRFKIRYRKYLETSRVYLEVKKKNNQEKIDKKRMEVNQFRDVLTSEETRFVLRYVKIDTSVLKPTLQTQFKRFTLVNIENRERITIDTNLTIEGFSKKVEYPVLVICEQKLDKSFFSNFFVNLLKCNNIYPSSFSKYCFGMVALNPSIKYNRFKNRILTINKLSNDSGNYNVAG